jgi:hypothetical protein
VLGDLGIAELSANRAQCGEPPLLIFAHQPRIASNIDSEDRCQPPLDPLSVSFGRSRHKVLNQQYDRNCTEASRIAASSISSLRSNGGLGQFVEQRLGLFEVGGIEAFGKPAEDGGEQGSRFAACRAVGVGGRGSLRRAIPRT